MHLRLAAMAQVQSLHHNSTESPHDLRQTRKSDDLSPCPDCLIEVNCNRR